VRSKRVELDEALEALETRWRMLEGKPSESHRHRYLHCGAYSVCYRHTGKSACLRPQRQPTAE
jgi:hypothetical protein